jgi:hypothetical protein
LAFGMYFRGHVKIKRSIIKSMANNNPSSSSSLVVESAHIPDDPDDPDVVIEAVKEGNPETVGFKRRCLSYHKTAIDLLKCNMELKKKMEDDWRKKIAQLDCERQNLLKTVHSKLVVQVSNNVMSINFNPEFMEV